MFRPEEDCRADIQASEHIPDVVDPSIDAGGVGEHAEPGAVDAAGNRGEAWETIKTNEHLPRVTALQFVRLDLTARSFAQ
jgi:hypothetical protein